MGWWDSNVYGGDTPWDYLGEIGELIGWHDYDADPIVSLTQLPGGSAHDKYEICKKLEAKFDQVLELADKHQEEIWYQVLAQLIMDVGAKFPQPLRFHCIKMALTDEWALEADRDRMQEMARLAHDITFYKDGEPKPWSTNTESFQTYLKEMVRECT